MTRLRFFFLFALSAILLGAGLWIFPVPLTGSMAVLKALLCDGLLLLALAGLGRSFLLRTGLLHRSVAEEFFLSLALGLVVLGLFLSLLGANGGLYHWLIWLSLGALLVTQWGHLRHFAAQAGRAWGEPSGSQLDAMQILALNAALLGIVATLFLCLAPVTFFDALNYHLAGAQRAAQSARWLPQADNFFTWLPAQPQPLWAAGILLAGLPLTATAPAALLNLAAGVALAWVVWDACRRWIPAADPTVAAALACTQPLLILSFGTFSPDGWMALFAFLSLYAFLCAGEEEDASREGAWLGLAALFAGAACASKLVAVLHAAALGALFLWELRQRPHWRRPSWLGWAFFWFVLPLLPWLLQGLALRGQPLYPFGLTLFGHEFLQGFPANYGSDMKAIGGAWWRLPWDVFYKPAEYGGNGQMSCLLLGLIPFAWAWRKTRVQRSLLLYVGLGALAWCCGPHVLRFGLFILPPACLLAAQGVHEGSVWARSKGWSKAWRALVLTGLFAGAAQCFVILGIGFDPWDAALGLQDPVQYLSSRHVPQAEAAAWIESRPGPWRVVLVGDPRTAYLPPETLSCGFYQAHPMKAWVKEAKDVADLDAIVRRKGYDFLFIHRVQWAAIESPEAPLCWDRGDHAAEARFKGWVQQLATEPQRPRLELSQGAGWVFDLR